MARQGLQDIFRAAADIKVCSTINRLLRTAKWVCIHIFSAVERSIEGKAGQEGMGGESRFL